MYTVIVLLLPKVKKVSKPLTGKIMLTLNTVQDDNNSDIAEHDLNLRHIQVIEGHITVSETVKPEAIDIKITQGKKTRLNETVQWQLTPQN
jgi:hypothetical protein